jgi:AraC-like DNA-binding protein
MQLLIHGLGTYGPDAAIGPACWPHHDLIVVTAGTVVLRSGRRRLALRAEDAVLIPPGTAFVGEAGPGGGAIWVQHFAAAAGDLPAGFRRARGVLALRGAGGGEAVGMLLRRLHQLHERRGTEVLRLRTALFAALLAELALVPRAPASVEAGVDAPRMQPALRWAESNLGAARTLGTLARQAGLSESHFRSLFRRERGVAAGAWLRERRMAEARRLLAQPELPLKEIAARLGYGDGVSFNRAFTRHHGTPPGRYRRRRAPLV